MGGSEGVREPVEGGHLPIDGKSLRSERGGERRAGSEASPVGDEQQSPRRERHDQTCLPGRFLERSVGDERGRHEGLDREGPEDDLSPKPAEKEGRHEQRPGQPNPRHDGEAEDQSEDGEDEEGIGDGHRLSLLRAREAESVAERAPEVENRLHPSRSNGLKLQWNQSANYLVLQKQVIKL